VAFTKNKIENSSKVFKEGNEVVIRSLKDAEPTSAELNEKDSNYLFSVISEGEKNNTQNLSADTQEPEKFYLKIDENQSIENHKTNHLFLIVRSLKNEDGTQKGYPLELGDIVRLGRIEYRVIEYRDQSLQTFSLLQDSSLKKNIPFTLGVKQCNIDEPKEANPDPNESHEHQCRLCFMTHKEKPEDVLINPCNCAGTSKFIHMGCLQEWISSKLKKKVNPTATCFYWKKLNCEVCKTSYPDLVCVDGRKLELVPIYRPENPFILLERVFYDKTKESGDNSKMMILLSLSNETNQIKLGRGHECDLRENDISVSRLHAYIKYENGQFVVIDNNSKFGTLILLRKNFKIEKKKIALQIGRTVITFSLKHTSVNNVPIFKNPMLMEKLSKWQSPKGGSSNTQQKPSVVSNGNKHKNLAVSVPPETEKQDNFNLNGSFID